MSQGTKVVVNRRTIKRLERLLKETADECHKVLNAQKPAWTTKPALSPAQRCDARIRRALHRRPQLTLRQLRRTVSYEDFGVELWRERLQAFIDSGEITLTTERTAGGPRTRVETAANWTNAGPVRTYST